MSFARIGKGFFVAALSENGQLGGPIDATGDYSAAPTTWRLYSPPGSNLYITHLSVVFADSAIDPDRYGNQILGTGISCGKYDIDDHLVTNLTPFPIKTLADWACYADHVEIVSKGPSAMCHISWTLAPREVAGLLIHGVTAAGPIGQYLRFDLSDDFTGLTYHRMVVQGYRSDQLAIGI